MKKLELEPSESFAYKDKARKTKAAEADALLFEGIKNQDQKSLELLYNNYFSRLSRFITKTTQDPSEALDVINEVFLTVWRDASKFRGDSSISSWIMGIAYNKALASTRKKRKWLVFSDELDLVVDESGPSSDYDDMRKIMKKLTAEQRAMMELTYYFGYSYDEIAVMLKSKPSVIRHQLYSARKQVKTLMREE